MADEPFERGDARLVGLDRVVVVRPSLVLLHPDPHEIMQEVMALGQAVQRFAGQVLLRDLTAYSDEAGRGFRFEAGRRSEAKPATIPI